MIVVTVFLSILNQMELHLVQNPMENCPHDHIPFNVKGNGNIVFTVHQTTFLIMVARLKAPLIPPKSRQYGTEGFKMGLQLGFHYATSLSDSQCAFCQSGHVYSPQITLAAGSVTIRLVQFFLGTIIAV